jgi:hypothetical protein
MRFTLLLAKHVCGQCEPKPASTSFISNVTTFGLTGQKTTDFKSEMLPSWKQDFLDLKRHQRQNFLFGKQGFREFFFASSENVMQTCTCAKCTIWGIITF